MRQFACVNTERKGDAPHQQRTYIAAAGIYLGLQLIVSTYLANYHAKKEKEKKSPTSKSILFND
jgi:hypothetical protein